MKLSDYFKRTPSSTSSSSTEISTPSVTTREISGKVEGRKLTKLEQGSRTQLPPEKKTKIQSVFAQQRRESTRLHESIIRASYKQAVKSENPELRLFLHHYLQKAANWDVKKAEQHDRPTPLIGQKVLSYHREYREEYNTLLAELSAAVRDQATENGMPILHEKEILLIADPSVKETMKCYCDILEPDHMDSFNELDGLIQNLIDAAREGETEPPCYLLVDKLIDPSLPFAERAKAVKVLNMSLMEYLETSLSDVEPDVRQRVLQRFGLISIQKVENQHVIICPKGGPKHMASDSTKRTFIHERISKGGHVPTMLQARTALVELTDFDNLIKVPKKLSKIKETQFDSIEKFHQSPIVDNYFQYGTTFYQEGKQMPNPITLLCSANAKLFEGLKDSSINTLLADPNKGPVINSSLNRVEHLMKLSLENTDNYPVYALYHELLAEELLLLLNITKPYSQEDFQKIYLENRERTLEMLYTYDETQRPPQPREPPIVVPFSSGSSCANAVLRGFHQIKPDAVISCFSDNYFETTATLLELKGNSILEEEKPSHVSIDSKQWWDNLNSIGYTREAPDVVYLDFRSNVSVDATEYQSKPLDLLTDILLKRRPEDKPLTLALDVTLDKLHSKEIDQFISEHRDEIDQGKLNIILYRSGQKFDQLGVDKFNAGYMEVHSSDPKVRETFQNMEGQLDGLDYQALCHYHKNADFEIHQYLKLHNKNSAYAYKKMGELVNNRSSFLQISPRYDEKLFFLEFTYPKMDRQSMTFQCALMDYIEAEARRQGIQVINRDSFGYTESSMCVINSKKIRLALGSHPPDELDKICNIILTLEKKLQEKWKESAQGKSAEELELRSTDQIIADESRIVNAIVELTKQAK